MASRVTSDLASSDYSSWCCDLLAIAVNALGPLVAGLAPMSDGGANSQSYTGICG